MDKKTVGIGASLIIIGILVSALLTWNFGVSLYLQGQINADFTTNKPIEVHAQITMFKDNIQVFSQYHSGVVTDLGDNMTIFKMFGNDSYQYGSIAYNANATYISIGNNTGTLSSTSTVLPNEWNRTSGTIEVIGQSQINISCTFYPTGTQVADCIGLNFGGTDDANDLWAYDTFSEVTGIDDTFTINIEFQITVSYT